MHELSLGNIKLVVFEEFPHKHILDERISPYDVTSEQYPRLDLMQKSYCIKLLTKVLHLRKKERIPFLSYQYKELKDPFKWLICLSMLLESNCKLLLLLNYEKQLKEWVVLIESKIKLYEGRYLLQAPKKEKPAIIYTPLKAFQRLKWNGMVNQIGDYFYQGRINKTSEGLPYIEGSKRQFVDLIHRNFCKKDGSLFSRSTLDTILTPSREDKRPNLDNRIPLNEVWDED